MRIGLPALCAALKASSAYGFSSKAEAAAVSNASAATADAILPVGCMLNPSKRTVG
jgi:hypothetical protein